MKVKITVDAFTMFLKLLKTSNIDLPKEIIKFSQMKDVSNAESMQMIAATGLDLFMDLFVEFKDDTTAFLKEIIFDDKGKKITDTKFKDLDIMIDIIPLLKDYPGWQTFFKQASKQLSE